MKKLIRRLAVILCVIAVGCAGVGIYKYFQEKNAGQEYEKLKAEMEKQPSSESTTEEQTSLEIPIDFVALQKENPEAYAWIKVDGTNIDYPILQSETDNAYYLTHTIENKESPEGAIFTENYNTKTFEDTNTVIYGHNMKNGSMFRTLHNYMDKDFFNKNRDVTIYTPDEVLHYKIFAAYLSDARHILKSYDFSNKQIYQNYIDTIFSMRSMDAFVDTSMKVTNDDKIITMSTCYAGLSDRRYLVQAVLVSIEK